MDAYLLGSIGDKYRIYDRTPGAKVRFCDYPKHVVEESYRSKKIRFNGLDIDNNTNHRKLTIHTNGIDTIDLNKVLANPFFLIDIVKVGHMEYLVEAINAVKCQEVTVDLNEVVKYTKHGWLNIFYNIRFIQQVNYDGKDKSFIQLKNGSYYKLESAIKAYAKPINIRQHSKYNEDRLAYSKLKLLVDSCDNIVRDIYEYGEVECGRWFRLYSKYTSTTADYESIKLDTSKFHKPIPYDKLLKSSKDVVRSSYMVFGESIETGKNIPLNNTITNLVNFITYFSAPLNLSFKQYESLILLKNSQTAKVVRNRLYSDSKYSLTSINIKYTTKSNYLEYSECELLTLAVYGEIVYSCCIKQKKFIEDILKYIEQSKKLLVNKGPKRTILSLLEPGYVCGFRQTYYDIDMPKKLRDIIEAGRDEIQNIHLENNKINIALPILGEGIIVTEAIDDMNAMIISKIEKDFKNIDKNYVSAIGNYLFYSNRKNQEILEILES